MTFKFSRTALLAATVSLACVSVASAAPATKPSPEAAKVGERRVIIMRGGPDGPGFRNRDPEVRAAHLRDILQLTPAQEPALRTFLEASKPEIKFERRERPAPDAPRPAPLTTPERLDREAARMAERQAAFAKRAAATKAFYAQLTAPQKKAFDALHPGGRGPHGPGGPGRRAFHGGPDGMALGEFGLELQGPPEPSSAPGA